MNFRDRFYNLIPFIILIVGTLSTIILWRFLANLNIEKEKRQLAVLTDETEAMIANRLKTYEDAHYAGGALFHTFGNVNREQWRTWMTSTGLTQLYPGINGIGLAVRIPVSDTAAFVREMRREIPDFKITGKGLVRNPSELFVIKYIEPVETNKPAVGFDMGSEPKRRAAMEKALLEGRTAVSHTVFLVQDERKRPGFLMYVPVYESIEVPPPSERLKKFRGWVYSPFITSDFLEGLARSEMRHIAPYISFSLYDANGSEGKTLLYEYTKTPVNPGSPSIERKIRVYDHEWVLKVVAGKKLEKMYVNDQPVIILVSGLLLTALLSVFVFSLSNTRQRAVNIANEMTGELQKLNIGLEQKVASRTKDLEQINRFYESLIQAMHEALVVLDQNLRIIKVNQRFQQLFKIDMDIEGFALTDLKNVEWTPVLHDIQASFAENKMLEKEYYFQFPDNDKKYFSFTSIPLRDGAISSQRVLLVIGDITDKKEYERQRNDFIGFVTHELRTPLSNLKAYAQLSERYFQQNMIEEAHTSNIKMQQFIETLKNLVSELHDVTKVSSGKLQIIRDVFNYGEFVEETIHDAVLTYPNFTITRNGNVDVLVNADRYRLNQVLTNYISNAVKFSPGKNEIIISVYIDGKNVVTSVKDFGTGIPKENIPKIFQRLYRVQKHAKTEGLGLGLYLSKEIIKAHGGEVWVESEEGKGSEFFYSLPVEKQL